MNIKKLLNTGLLLFAVFSTAVAQQGEVQISQDSLIPQLMELKADMAKANRLGDRYMIQLYSGNNSTAAETIEEYRELFSEWPSTIVYETPNYKVWIGNFRNTLEADRALVKIREEFPAAFRFKPNRR